MKQLLTAFIKTALGSISSSGLFAVFTIIAARSVSFATIGLFLSAYSIALLLTDVVDMGTGNLEILNSHNQPFDKVKRNLRELATGRFTIYILIFIIAFPLALKTHILALSTTTILMSLLFSLRILLQTELRANRRYSSLAFVQILERSLALLLLFTLNLKSAVGLEFIFIISNCFVIVLFRWYPIFITDYRIVFLKYKKAFGLGVSSFSTDLPLLDLSLVSIYSSNSSAGEYALCSRLLAPILILMGALSSVLVREIGSDTLSISDVKELISRILKAIGLGTILLMALIIFFGSETLTLITGKTFQNSSILLLMIAGTVPFVLVYQLQLAMLQAYRRIRFLAKTTFFYGATYLIVVALISSHAGSFAPPIAQLVVSIPFIGFSYKALRGT